MNNNETHKKNSPHKFDELFKDEFAVILLQGKNSFGNVIYSYVQVALPNIKKLYSALNSSEDFSPSDFGTIIAAGEGEPSDELRAEMAITYKTLQPITPATFPPVTPLPLS
ncbi:MAG: hypothetical protein NTY50_01010 [Methylobacter sp.]|nr:hypothetical protein [Methylobacter sp.]